MAKYKIIIEKYLEEEINAETEDKAVDIAWEMWSQDNSTVVYVEKCEEE